MKSLFPSLYILCSTISLNTQSKEISIMSKKKLKVCSGNYNDGNKEFLCTYENKYKDGKEY